MIKLKDILGFINNDARIINANGEQIALVFQEFQDALSDKYLECMVLEISINETYATVDVMITMSKELQNE